MSNRSGQSVVTAVAVVIGAVGGVLGVSRAMHPRTSGASIAAEMNVARGQQDRMGRAIDQEMAPLLSDPSYEPELRRRAGPNATQERAREVGAELTAHGIPRLASPDLENFTRLRLVLAQRNDAVCAALWTGHGDGSMVANALTQLSDDDLHQWLRLSARAAVLELHANGPAPVDNNALSEGIQAISAAVQGDEHATVEAAINAGTNAPPAQGCAAMRIILREAGRLEPALRDRFLRALSAG